MRLPPLCLVLALCAVACGPYGGVEITGVDGYEVPGGVGKLPLAYQAGEKAPIVASVWEDVECCGKMYHTTSLMRPNEFTWTADDTTIARVRTGGVEMLKPGATIIRVQHSFGAASIGIRVVPRSASIRMSPDSADVAVNQVATFGANAFDATGGRNPAVTSGSGLVLAVPLDLATNYLNPIASYTAAGDTTISFIGMRPGLVRIAGFLPIYGAHKLRDTVTLVVR